jgi:hypothetical protein
VMIVLVDASYADAIELVLARKDEVIRSALGSYDAVLDPQSQSDAE